MSVIVPCENNTDGSHAQGCIMHEPKENVRYVFPLSHLFLAWILLKLVSLLFGTAIPTSFGTCYASTCEVN